ncbi:MAG: chorismate-binding protein [Crocinitomicaceae bacterium]|nr:chorismate-binding protein [Crocinitomicaceae bacterium]
MSEACFAYRLPEQNTVHYFKGQINQLQSIEDINEEGIVICSFDRSKIYQIQKIVSISPNEFKIHLPTLDAANTSKETYIHSYNEVINAIHSGRFEKIVLSKVKVIQKLIDPLKTFDLLNKKYSSTFNYLLSSEETGCWMGATPELLCSLEKGIVKTVSLAGTKLDEESWTNKELQEQLYVTEYIKDKLRNADAQQIVSDGPNTISAGPVNHLKTNLKADLSEHNWKKVLDQLHPTPATCGIPTELSMNFIQETEAHNRSFYTGFIGVFEQDKKQAFVNLRCMQIFNDSVALYLGGGIISGSDQEKEWQETERKALTLEKVIFSADN